MLRGSNLPKPAKNTIFANFERLVISPKWHKWGRKNEI